MSDALWGLFIGGMGFLLYWIIATRCYAWALSIQLALVKATANARHSKATATWLWLFGHSGSLPRLAHCFGRPQSWMIKYCYLLTTTKRRRQERVFRVWTHAAPSPRTVATQAEVTNRLREIAYACVAAEQSWHEAWEKMHQPAEPGTPAHVAASIRYRSWADHSRWLRESFTKLSATAEFFGYAVLGNMRDYLRLAGPPPDISRLIPS